ncbi:MAG TPA: glutamate racemase [Myxococcota bacterium]|nr:glutamate racemase [Myxococcota bacterium]HRY94503.1 glutamate racemase [Myxococcota bacterium]HSA21572.1 glutamate racemase [Myxococcota bacterium]
MPAPAPLGVFDSGFGGLTIFKRVRELLPDYDYVYLGDNARAPYGQRSFEVVLRFTQECVDHLFALGCPLVVIACNTASAKALRSIQQRHLPAAFPDRRVLGVIRPTVEAIAGHTRTGQVAVWATPGTVRSESFPLEIAHHAPGVRLTQQACPLLVPLVEAGELEGPGLDHFISKYWQETAARAAAAGAAPDLLLLACTHYPLIQPRIRALVPPGVALLAQDALVAPSLADYLRRHPDMDRRLSRGGSCRYLTTDVADHFDRLAEVFLGQPVASEKLAL